MLMQPKIDSSFIPLRYIGTMKTNGGANMNRNDMILKVMGYSRQHKKQAIIARVIFFFIAVCLVFELGQNVGEVVYYLTH